VKGRVALPVGYSQHWHFEKTLRPKIRRAAPMSLGLSAVRPQPSNDDSRGQEPLQAGSRFASLPTVAGLLLVGVVVQLLPIPSYSIRQCCIRGHLRRKAHRARRGEALSDGAASGLARFVVGACHRSTLGRAKLCYHALWPKPVIPLIGISYIEAAKLGRLAAFW
jgi:hypothetical protein